MFQVVLLGYWQTIVNKRASRRQASTATMITLLKTSINDATDTTDANDTEEGPNDAPAVQALDLSFVDNSFEEESQGSGGDEEPPDEELDGEPGEVDNEGSGTWADMSSFVDPYK
jgi:hypothetical protein